MADIFRTLATGGLRFDRKRFADDIHIFNPSGSSAGSSSSSSSSNTPNSLSTCRNSRGKASAAADEEKESTSTLAIPKELDFFGSGHATDAADPTSSNGKAAAKGKRKATNDDDDQDDDDEGQVTEPLTKSTLAAFVKAHHLKLSGTDVPLPMTAWSELETRWGAPRWLIQNLRAKGWGKPTPIQMAAAAVGLDNRDLLAGSPTGSGKTLAFLLPILHHLKSPSKTEGLRALIVSPTRELAQQIYDQLRILSEGKKFRTQVLTKSSEGNAMQDPKMRKKFDILITTPMRLVHAIKDEELDLSSVRHLVLDEADRLLEEGFLEQTDEILASCTHPSLRKSLFSATLPAGVEEMAKTFLVDECRIIVGTKDAATETIEQSLEFVGTEDGKLHALRRLVQDGGLKPPALIFVQSIERAKELYQELVYDGLRVDVIHSERPKAQRDAVVSAFKKGEVWILICTELMARGIDFKGVRLVLNYDFPQSVQSYVHRIGRTGRAGRKGRALTYFTKDDRPHLKVVVNVMRQSGCEMPDWLSSLKNPSQKERKRLRRKAVERQRVAVAAGSTSGRKEANKRREMILASKRRKGNPEGEGREKGKEGDQDQET